MAEPARRRGANPVCLLAATVIGSALVYIDGTAVNVALPVAQRDLGADLVDLQWVIESYAIMLAALLLLGGALGDRYGRKRLFALGLSLFAVASVWCGMAPDVGQLIGARALQGAGGALLIPGSLALITAHVPPERRGRAIGTWAAFSSVSVAIGPVLGGWLIDHASWRWVFYINPPLALVVLALLAAGVPESRDESRSGRFDYVGAALVALGLGVLVYGLLEAARHGFDDPAAAVSVAAGVVLLAAFIRVEARAEVPMMPLGLFRSRVFSGANAATFFLYAALGGGFFFLSFNMVQVQGWSATEAGLAFLPLILSISVLSQAVGRTVDRVGARWLLIAGPALSAVGYGLFILPGPDADYWQTFFPAMAALGVGTGIAVAPLTSVAMGAAPVAQSGVAAGVNNTASRFGTVLMLAVFGLIVVAAFNARLDVEPVLESLSPAARAAFDAERLNLAAAALPEGLPADAAAALRAAVEEGFVGGFRIVMAVCAGLALLASLAAALTVPSGGARAPVDGR